MALQRSASFTLHEGRVIIIIKTHADLSQSMKSSIRESIQSAIFPRVSLTRRLVRSFRRLRATRKFNRGLRVRPSESSYTTGERKKDELRMAHTRESRKVEISRAHPAFFHAVRGRTAGIPWRNQKQRRTETERVTRTREREGKRKRERVRKKTRSSEAIIRGNLSNSKGTTLYVPSSL